ncbi:MAG: hypothetical protein AAF721_16845 [Myxococcota bacterium]
MRVPWRAADITIRDRAGGRAQIDRMLAWKPERILLAHGGCVDSDGEAVLRRGLRLVGVTAW